jgi:hypothetical protein
MFPLLPRHHPWACTPATLWTSFICSIRQGCCCCVVLALLSNLVPTVRRFEVDKEKTRQAHLLATAAMLRRLFSSTMNRLATTSVASSATWKGAATRKKTAVVQG